MVLLYLQSYFFSTDFMLVYEKELDSAKKKSSSEAATNEKWRAKFMVNLRKNGLELEEVYNAI